MQYHFAFLCITSLCRSIVYAVSLPLPDIALLNQTAFQSSHNLSFATARNTTLDHDPSHNLYEFIADGIRTIHRRDSSTYSTMDLYKITISSETPTTDLEKLSEFVLNYRKIVSYSRETVHGQYRYMKETGYWVSEGSTTAWYEDEEFEAMAPIDWRNARPLSIRQAINDISWSPDPRIPYSQRHGPWRNIYITKYKETIPGFWNELTCRFENCNRGGLVHPKGLDVLVGARGGTAVLVPAKYDFSFPKPNPWGWGQDNRYTLCKIGPYKYIDYLKIGVALVTETMGNGYYKNARLIQVKIEDPHLQRKKGPGDVAEDFSKVTLYFRWQNQRGNDKLLEYSTTVYYDQDKVVESGNKWSGWDLKPKEFDWSQRREKLKVPGTQDPDTWLDDFDLSSLRMSVLSALQIRRGAIDRGAKSWVIRGVVYLCKPKDGTDGSMDGQLVYYFPKSYFLGTENGRVVHLTHVSATSNLTDTAAVVGNVIADY